ncbi:MAG: glycosyltransferase family 39 protein [Anaerolineae bacterium]
MSRQSFQILVLCVAAFILAAAMAWGVQGGMPQLEDEQANLFQAKVFASGHITAPEPVHPEAFVIPFIVHQNGHVFGKYPPGYPLLLAIGEVIDRGWIINALASALVVLGVYLLGRDLFNHDTGLLAAALGAISPMAFMLSGTLLAHTTAMAELIFFAWGWVRARRVAERHPMRFAVLAGLAIGWATITRPYTSVVIAVPFIVVTLHDLYNHPRDHWRTYGALVLVALGVMVIWPVYNFIATGSPTTNTYTLWWPYDKVGFGPGYGLIPSGHTWDFALLNFSYDFPDLGVTLFGWPTVLGLALSWVPIALGLAWPDHDRRDWALMLLPMLLVAAHLAYWARASSLYGPRYYAEGLPFLWLLGARGLMKFGATPWPRRVIKIALPILIAYSLVFTIEPRFLEAFDRYRAQRAHVDYIAAARLRNALVLVRASVWSDYASLAWQNAPQVERGNIIFAIDYGPNITAQLATAYPGRKVYYYDRTQSVPLVAGR